MKGNTMTAYATGWNMAGYMPNFDNVAEFRTREDALAYLLEELDYFTESAEIECDHDDEKQGSFDAQLELARADLKTMGTVTVSDYDDARYEFWVMPIDEPRYAYPNGYGPVLSQHDEIMTADQALEDLIASVELNDEDTALLFSETRHDATPMDNLRAIRWAADYNNIDIVLPERIN